MRFGLLPFALLLPALAALHPLQGQAPPSADARRAYASRSELEASLVEAEKVIASPGFSAHLRAAKAREADMIRQRLREGDFQVGDQLVIHVLGEAQFSDSFTVAPGRVVLLPGMPPISLDGVLRHESETYLAQQLTRVLRDPEVRVIPMIRLSVLGQVGRPGFYQFPADLVVTDAIMRAGGPAGGADPTRSHVRRSGSEIVSQDEFALALEEGRTLDQLNLRAGDEVVVSRRTPGSFSIRTITLLSGLTTSFIYLITRIF